MFRFFNKSYSKYQPGEIIHGWKLKKTQEISEFNFTSYSFTHEKTGAKFLHIDADDSNNVFSISFTTPPKDSKGIPHVLEHTTLCGSMKYPVRDPFFNMLRRSLNTYMNAWTYPDHTTYPFASQNLKDFYNLMSVYLDATLFPQLKETDFQQEGHRLEFNEKGQLEFKGIVFNEMKGAMGESDSYFSRYLHQKLFPNTCYSFNSGGDPEEILDMTYQELKDFHSMYYHPSNSKIFTYGNFPFEEHLKFISENFESFEKKEIENPFKKVTRFDKPERFFIQGPPDQIVANPEKQTKFAMGFLTCDHSDDYEIFALNFLSHLLLDEPRGPFYKALIESGLAPDFSPDTGFESILSEPSFVIGVQGIGKQDREIIEKKIKETFEQVYKEGINEKLIESSLHSIELSIKLKQPHMGINLCSSLVSNWIHTEDPIDSLFINEKIERLKREIQQGLLQKLVKKYFIDNTHQLIFEMEADEKFVEKLTEKEVQKLKEIESKLKKEEKIEIKKQAKLLKKLQEKEPDKKCLPTLLKKDIQKLIPFKMKLKEKKGISFNYQVTNEINFIKTLTKVSKTLPKELIPYLSLFASLITKIGAKEMNHHELAEKIESSTGGINANIIVIPSLTDSSQFDIAFEMNSYCLERNTEKMIDLMSSIYNFPNMNETDYIKTLIDQIAMNESNSIMSSGNKYSQMYSSSFLRESSKVQELIEGINSIKFINELTKKDVSEVIEKLKEVSRYILNKQMRVLATCNPRQTDVILKNTEKFMKTIQIPYHDFNPKSNFEAKNQYSFIGIPSQVNFVSQSIATSLSFSHPDHPLMNLVNKIQNKYLHTEIREKGGAYGSSSSFSYNGILSFTSYRDPNIQNTLQVFEKTIDHVLNSKWTMKDLGEAKLQTFQQLDSPTNPHEKSFMHFLYGINDKLKQRRRNIILSAKKDDIYRVCNEYLKTSDLKAVSVLGSSDQIPEEIQKDEKWNKILN